MSKWVVSLAGERVLSLESRGNAAYALRPSLWKRNLLPGLLPAFCPMSCSPTLYRDFIWMLFSGPQKGKYCKQLPSRVLPCRAYLNAEAWLDDGMIMFLFFCVYVFNRKNIFCSGWVYVTFLSVPVSTVTYRLLFSPAYKVTVVLCYSFNVHSFTQFLVAFLELWWPWKV